MNSDRRLVELESRYMELEKLYEQLNEVVIEQQARIEQLARDLAALRDSVGTGPEATEPPPPHY